MDGDLSLSQTLGGLRIANPDDASSPSSHQDSLRNPGDYSPSALSYTTSLADTESRQSNSQIPPIPIESSGRPLSHMDFDPASYSTDNISFDEPSSHSERSIPRREPSSSQRRSNRQSSTIPQTYGAQQQAQFPQYPTMVPQSQRQANPNIRPPTSLPPRDGSYRLHKETSQSSLNGTPRRHGSRATGSAMQAGIPSREGSYSDRSYRSVQQMPRGNGPFPPRRSSRGLTGGSATSVVGSPYSIEGGPLHSSEEWQDKGAAAGMKQVMDANGRSTTQYVKKGVKDFHFGRTLGEGSYSTVMLATDRQTLKEYAIKVLDKRHIIKEKKVKYVNIEKDTLNRLTSHPGVVRLYYTFQDERSLYFVLDVASGGELLGVLKRMTTFDEECTRFYAAQILDTVEYMHSRGVIHRDLKPENVLLDDQMHIKITDFGTAKLLDASNRPRANSNGFPLPGDPVDGLEENRAVSFVGTAEYVSPELLVDKNACKASDLWAFGCIVYQLLAGRPPFKASNEYLTFQKIVQLEYTFPRGFPPVARDLIERLLVLDPARRLALDHIKNHEFFDGIKWGRGLWEQKAPRLKSYVPPNASPLKLNGSANDAVNGNSNYPPDIAPSHTTHQVHIPSNGNVGVGGGQTRPAPRVITELPPPSQLDIEWSPVLTRNNERILKLGDQLVLPTPASNSPTGKGHGHGGDGNKFSRFFGGGGTTKKRPRLVMVTSSARIIIAEAGGDNKKSKSEIALLAPGCSWKKQQDPKGLSYWCIDTVSRCSIFAPSV